MPRLWIVSIVVALIGLMASLNSAPVAAQSDACAYARGGEKTACEQSVQIETCKKQTGAERMKCQSEYTSQSCKTSLFPSRCHAMAAAHARCHGRAGDYVKCVNEAEAR